MNRRYPRYPDDADYQTNAPSYYEDLARKQKLIEMLAKKIWEYEETLDLTLEQISNRLESYIKENDNLMNERLEQWDLNLEKFPENVELLLEEWLSDGTLDHIINDTIFNWKADKTYVDSEIGRLDQIDEHLADQLTQTVSIVPKIEGDATVTLQEHIDEAVYEVYLTPDHTYNVSELLLKSNMVLDGRGATLYFNDNQPTLTSVLKIIEKENIVIKNLIIDGNRINNFSNQGVSDQDGGNHGIAIITSDHVTIENVVVKNTGTDGIYVGEVSGGYGASNNITLKNVTSDNNARQGLSVIHCNDLYVYKSNFINTNGKSPSAGVDIEPNVDVNQQNFIFEKCIFYGNAGRGIVIQNKGVLENVLFIHCEVKNNDFEGIRVTGSGEVKHITFDNVVIKENASDNWFGIPSLDVINLKLISVTSDIKFRLQNCLNYDISRLNVVTDDMESNILTFIDDATGVIKDSYIKGGKDGIHFESSSTGYNRIINNKLEDVARKGISITNDHNIIKDNEVNALTGIEITEGGYNQIYNNTINVTASSFILNSKSLNNVVFNNIISSDFINSGGSTNIIQDNLLLTDEQV